MCRDCLGEPEASRGSSIGGRVKSTITAAVDRLLVVRGGARPPTSLGCAYYMGRAPLLRRASLLGGRSWAVEEGLSGGDHEIFTVLAYKNVASEVRPDRVRRHATPLSRKGKPGMTRARQSDWADFALGVEK
jgi:hypothetical protein